jgi:hypothetical protein
MKLSIWTLEEEVTLYKEELHALYFTQTKGNQMGRTCCNINTVFFSKPWREELGVSWRITIKWIQRNKACVIVDWIQVAKDRNQWLDLVNTLMNFADT